jgi:ABC-type multidrug transport system fused ATPase/permease subunit
MVQQALNNLMVNRSTLVIAHRLSTIQHADRIVVLENGRIVGVAPHRELLQQNDLYRRLYDMQFKQM